MPREWGMYQDYFGGKYGWRLSLTQKLGGLTKNGDQTGEVTAITRRSPIVSEEFHLWVVYLGIGQFHQRMILCLGHYQPWLIKKTWFIIPKNPGWSWVDNPITSVFFVQVWHCPVSDGLATKYGWCNLNQKGGKKIAKVGDKITTKTQFGVPWKDERWIF